MYQSECYCTNLRRSANAVSDYYDAEMKGTGLTSAQYYLLITLSRLESANITHWAENVGLDRSTMVRNIRLLESRGLVEGTPGHGKSFTLSREGRSRLEAAVPVWREAQRKIEAFLGEEDAQAVLRIGERLRMLKNDPRSGER